METNTPQEIIIGRHYLISGNIANGRNADGTPVITKDIVVRKVTRVTATHVILECGRRFIIDKDLNVTDNHIRVFPPLLTVKKFFGSLQEPKNRS